MSTVRKGASRMQDIPPDVLDALSSGTLTTATLTEGLAIDQVRLLRCVFPDLPAASLAAAQAATDLGIVKRMAAIAALLLETVGPSAITTCQSHLSDTVRGWACFMIGADPASGPQQRLQAIQPLADDPHFGVREWAWLAVRPALVRSLSDSIDALIPWTASPSERVRRFASEALRPRGVWCSHIPALKKDPAQGLPLLAPLRADPAVYVQDSVANWLNDAAKDQPDWVRALCEDWRSDTPTPATDRICTRALRNLT